MCKSGGQSYHCMLLTDSHAFRDALERKYFFYYIIIDYQASIMTIPVYIMMK